MTFQGNLLPKNQWQPQQKPSPPPALRTNCASITEMQPPYDTTLKFSEPHLATNTPDLPLWEDTFDRFNFDLAAPHTSLTNNFVVTTDELINQLLATPLEPMPANAMTGDPSQSPTLYLPLPASPGSLSSTTTSLAATAPPLLPLSTIHSTLIHASTSITLPSTTRIPAPKPQQRRTFPCTSPYCGPTATVRNPETTHHHHHKDPKHSFCCRYEACSSCTSYTTKKDRNRHEGSKHSGQQLTCDVCGHRTARKDNMRVHVRREHRDGWEEIMKRIVGARMRVVMGSR